METHSSERINREQQDIHKQSDEANELLRARMKAVWYEEFKDYEGNNCMYIEALLNSVREFESELRMLEHKDDFEIQDHNIEGFREKLEAFKKLLSKLE